mgnify:CR=1 FL=1
MGNSDHELLSALLGLWYARPPSHAPQNEIACVGRTPYSTKAGAAHIISSARARLGLIARSLPRSQVCGHAEKHVDLLVELPKLLGICFLT